MGHLTGRGAQRSGIVDHKKVPPRGDLTGTGDQPRGKWDQPAGDQSAV